MDKTQRLGQRHPRGARSRRIEADPLKLLVSLGCSKEVLIRAIGETVQFETRPRKDHNDVLRAYALSPKKVRTQTKHMKQISKFLRKLERAHLFTYGGDNSLQDLCGTLERIAGGLEAWLPVGWAHSMRFIFCVSVVEYVRRITGKPHCGEIATLLDREYRKRDLGSRDNPVSAELIAKQVARLRHDQRVHAMVEFWLKL